MFLVYLFRGLNHIFSVSVLGCLESRVCSGLKQITGFRHQVHNIGREAHMFLCAGWMLFSPFFFTTDLKKEAIFTWNSVFTGFFVENETHEEIQLFLMKKMDSPQVFPSTMVVKKTTAVNHPVGAKSPKISAWSFKNNYPWGNRIYHTFGKALIPW